MQRLALIRILAVTWLISSTGLVYSFTAFSQDVRGYDYESLAWAAAVGLAGGIAQTILWLAAEDEIVIDFWRKLLRDVVVALIGGAIVYAVFNGLASVWPQTFGKELRMLAVFFAGFSRGRWREVMVDMASAGVSRARTIVTGKEPPPRGPVTVSIPIVEK